MAVEAGLASQTIPGVSGAFNGAVGGLENAIKARKADLLAPTDAAQLKETYGETQSGLSQQQALVNALMAQHGIQNQSDVYGQLQGVANGTGPNPAQAMLANATGQNVANQAALAAGQRGASQNVGMIARNAAQQGSAAEQNAAGQGAALQANQSLNALNSMGNISGQQVQNQANAVGNYNQFAQGAQQNLLNAVGNYNNAMVGGQNNVNNNKTAIGSKILDSVGQAAGAGGQAAAMSEGGMAEPKSHIARHFMAQGGKVEAIVSPGEAYIPPSNVDAVAKGKMSVKDAGEIIPGKAKVKGDSLKNDTVPKTLDAGGVVVKRSVMNKHSDNEAAKFVQAVLAKHSMKKK